MKIFAPTDTPRVYAIPPGQNFAVELVRGLHERCAGISPLDIARIKVFVNTNRVQQGIMREYTALGPCLIPKLVHIADLATRPGYPDIPGPVSSLSRRLELLRTVEKLLEGDERFGSRTAAYDLADSLANLLDELHSEGIHPDKLSRLDVSDYSAHWEQSLKFLGIIQQYWGTNATPDVQSRQRLVVDRIVAEWDEDPPGHPVLVAGSTGSRGATQKLMAATAGLPQGAVVLPCFDFEMPRHVWDAMGDSETGEDHPQYRFKSLMNRLGIGPEEIRPWNEQSSPRKDRNRLVSLAMRPAPITDQWMEEGPRLGGISDATEKLALLEAPGPRTEAVAIALRLREAAERGQEASLVTPDRKLAQQVKAALERWGIEPFDADGEPLILTAPGRLLLMTADLLVGRMDAVELIALLYHPITHSGSERGRHRRFSRRLEHKFRSAGMAADVSSQIRETFLSDGNSTRETTRWVGWITDLLEHSEKMSQASLAEFVSVHLHLSERFAAGSSSGSPEALWNRDAGKVARELFSELEAVADVSGLSDPASYAYLFRSLAGRRKVRHAHRAFEGISIWSTLDARMQSPDLVIAGGLNEGTWPAEPTPDPWLNRKMRIDAGLLLPDRKIGLLAHDFQQVIAAPEVVLSRSVRNSGVPTVQSRLMSRLTSLLSGIGPEGRQALARMRERGNGILRLAEAMEAPSTEVAPANRPAPAPPLSTRPAQLSVTAIKTLITNPYETYAKHVLRLRELDPLGGQQEYLQKGIILHAVLERFVAEAGGNPQRCIADRLLAIAEEEVEASSSPLFAKRLWLAQLRSIADEFVECEHRRMQMGKPGILERKGTLELEDPRFTLSARVDRVDWNDHGKLMLYDYKSGTIPGKAAIRRYDKQIPLSAIMIERGAFDEVPEGRVVHAAYIKIGNETREAVVDRELESGDMFAQTWELFEDLIRHYQVRENGYVSRLAMGRLQYESVYDRLARYGEWDDSADAVTIVVE